MINVDSIIVAFGEPTEIAPGFTVECVANKGERPANAVFWSDQIKLEEPDFAELIFDKGSNQLRPSFDLVCWDNAIMVVTGLRKWLVLGRPKFHLMASVNLDRKAQDDTGFYRVQWLEANGLLVGIYEGGVVAIDPKSGVRWQVGKAWSDELLGCEDGRIEFLRESGRVSLNLETGQLI